jgi:hypothetical protein
MVTGTVTHGFRVAGAGRAFPRRMRVTSGFAGN